MNKIIVLIITITLLTSCNKTKITKNSLLDIINNDIQIESITDIEYIEIKDDSLNDIRITDKDDFAFLNDYMYKGKLKHDRINELFTYPGTNAFKVKIKGKEVLSLNFVVVSNGEIVFVGEDEKRVYSSKDPFTAKKRAELFKKYNGEGLGDYGTSVDEKISIAEE